MENDNKKLITLSFVVMAALTYSVIRVIFQALAVSFGVVGKYWAITSVQHGLPLVVAVVTFGVLQFNPKIVAWGDEVFVEVKKVVWPSKKDTIAMTVVSCVMLLIAGLVLGVFDFSSNQIIKMILSM